MIRTNGLTLVLAFLVAACASGGGDPRLPDEALEVEPNYVCAGETVRLSWNRTDLPRDRSFCDVADGGFTPRRTCERLSDCPTGGRCRDGLCILEGVDPEEVDYGGGCWPDTFTSVTPVPSVTIAPPIGFDTNISGRRDVTVTETTRFIAAFWRNAPREYNEDSEVVNVVDTERTTPVIIEYASTTCNSRGDTLSVDLETLPDNPVRASDRIGVVRVTNISGFPVSVSATDPDRSEPNLDPGTTTEALNGPARGVWSASELPHTETPLDISPDDCLVTGRSLWRPPIRLQLELACVAPVEP